MGIMNCGTVQSHYNALLYKVMKYRKILIKYNVYFKNAVFHSRENKNLYFTTVKI